MFCVSVSETTKIRSTSLWCVGRAAACLPNNAVGVSGPWTSMCEKCGGEAGHFSKLVWAQFLWRSLGVLLRAAARSIYEKGGPSLQLLLPSCKDRTKAIVAAKTENHCQGFRPFRALFHHGFMGLLQKDEKQQLLGLLIIWGRWPFCCPRVWSRSLTNPNPTDFFGGDPTFEKTGAVSDFAKIPLIRKRCLVFAHDFSH